MTPNALQAQHSNRAFDFAFPNALLYCLLEGWVLNTGQSTLRFSIICWMLCWNAVLAFPNALLNVLLAELLIYHFWMLAECPAGMTCWQSTRLFIFECLAKCFASILCMRNIFQCFGEYSFRMLCWQKFQLFISECFVKLSAGSLCWHSNRLCVFQMFRWMLCWNAEYLTLHFWTFCWMLF